MFRTQQVAGTANFQVPHGDLEAGTEFREITDGRQPLFRNFCQIFVKTLEMDKMGRFMQGGKIIDAWGNEVKFRYPGILKNGGFDLISAGADGGFGTDAESDPPNEVKDYRDEENGEWICDDIAKF